jgi:hypothetical protein
MNLEQICDLWDADCAIDQTKLTEESLKTPLLHSRYLRLLMQFKEKLLSQQLAFEEMKTQKLRYYRGELTKEELEELGLEQYQGVRPLKSDMQSFLDGDKDLNRKLLKIKYLETTIYQLESILNQIKARDWNIRNAIEFLKFQAGS